jgi:carboxypeptidase family protein
MQRLSIKRNLLVSLVVALCAVTGAWGQVGTTSIRGVVTDKTGAAIVGAKVTLTNLGQALQREAQSGATGEYEFLVLPPGTYSLTVEMTNFRKFEHKNIQLLVNTPATINVALEVGVATQVVEVSAQAVTLNTSDATLGIAFNENQVKQLPLEGRNVPDLLSLQAGVVYTGNRSDINVDVDTRSGAVNGARSDQSTVMLDGINVNDSGGHAFTSVLPVTLDSVQEFRVTTTNYNADQGGSSGAQVALVTKSGTNSFHGSVYEYHRNTYTSANDFFVKSAELSSGQPNDPPKLIRNVFGASVGGPIKKERFYFFLNYEGTRRAEANSAVRTVPTASLRDGVIQYLCQTNPDGTPDTVTCPGNTVTGFSGKTYTAVPGNQVLGRAEITKMDTQGIGPSTVMLNYFNGYPLPNDTTVGDGVNYSGFRFPAPIHDLKNWYIAKLDYNITANGKHRVSWSGALANQGNPQEPFLPNSNAPAPGNLSETTFLSYNKGFVANYSGVLSPHVVNNFRYGYLRESNAFIGDSNEQWIFFRGLSQGVTRSSDFQRPQHQFADDLVWTKGNHSLQYGVQLAYIRNPRVTQGPSFSDGVTNASWLDSAGFAGSGETFDPSVSGFPAVDGSFANSYDFPLIAMLGMVTEVDASYNYLKDGTVLAQGAPVKRRFAADTWEFYVQDSWKIKPNFTLTYGLRYSLFSPPWEANGLQVSPSFTTANGGKSFDLGAWFNQRGANMLKGIPSNQDPLISFDLSGPANGGKGNWYNWDYHNFGPRLAFAWSPRPHSGLLQSIFGEGDKTAVRGGFSIVYDRIGAGLLNTFDSTGSFGLSTTLSNPAGVVTADCAPRLTDLHAIPTADLCGDQLLLPAPPGGFPQTFPSTLDTGGFAIAWGIDASVKTPYSYTLDFSVERQLPKGFAFQVSYVGRLSHRLLAQDDLAMPLDLVDPASKVDYFSAVTALAKVYRTGVDTLSFNSSMVPANIAKYWQDMIQPLVSGGAYRIRRCTPNNVVAGTTDPVVAAYDLFCGFSLNETTALFVWDLLGIRDKNISGQVYFPAGGPNSFFNPQYSSLYAWRSNTNANYHALQVNFRHPMSRGVQFDFNYTFSKSIDIMSDAERIGAWGGLGGQIINSWDPKAMRAVSDYDAKHQFNANWVAELPFGKGKAVAGNAHGALDAIIGGWQLSGLFRITSGFPFNVFGGFNWPTNWQLGGNALLVGPVKTGHFTVQSGGDAGSVNAFANGPAAIDSFRAPFPGESGARNQVRGDGFFGIDMGLAKRWKMPFSEKQSLQFRWEVFNITNSVRFNVQSNPPELDISPTFGNYTGLITNPRVMQFALRYEF